jgi:hypothetical protein
MHRTALALLVALALASNAGAAPETPFGFRELVELIDRQSITSIEALLPELPERLRRNFTLVKQSDSLQGGSAEYPRAILFGDDARLVVAFNGHERQGGFRKLEVIEATDEGPLEFREIRFAADGKKAPQVSEANPRSCLNCHGTGAGYRWSGYPSWPGMYGEDDDGIADETADAKAYDAFRAMAEKHPRYAALVFPGGEENRRYPYWTDSEHRNLDRMPNTRFSKAVLRNEARARIARSAKREWFGKAKHAWAFDALACDDATLSLQGRAALERSRSAARDAVPEKARGKRDAVALARLAALEDTAMHADYRVPDRDGVHSWDTLLDSALLAHVARDFEGLASAIEPMRRPLVDHYGKEAFAGTEFRPAALDERLVVVGAATRRYDDDDFLVFFGFPPAPEKPVRPPKDACDSLSDVFEGRI